jgi:hypothetical protein
VVLKVCEDGTEKLRAVQGVLKMNGLLGMNEADRREKMMLDLFDWITDFVAGRDDVTADDIRLVIAREFADGPRERDALLAQYRERAEAAYRLLRDRPRQGDARRR